jgi:membrane-associated phospholipid phosphatase
VLLAHWASDVVAGLVIGAVTERILRLVTGYGRDNGLPTSKPEATKV